MQQFPTIRLAIPPRAAAPFDHPDWVFELKHDGFRALALIDGGFQLVSRKNNVYKSFGPLREVLAGLRVQNAVLDGEIVCLDNEERSQFKLTNVSDSLQERVFVPSGKRRVGDCRDSTLFIEVNCELYEVFLPRLTGVVKLHHNVVNGLHKSLHYLPRFLITSLVELPQAVTESRKESRGWKSAHHRLPALPARRRRRAIRLERDKHNGDLGDVSASHSAPALMHPCRGLKNRSES